MNTDSHVPPRINELIDSMALLYNNGKLIPAVMLAYASIDICASLTRDDPNKDTRGVDFQSWVDTFFFPAPKIRLTADDLWAARCGLLHCMSPHSNLSRSGRATLISYAKSDEVAAAALQFPDTDLCRRTVIVSIPSLLSAVNEAICRYVDARNKDPELMKKFLKNAPSVFATM